MKIAKPKYKNILKNYITIKNKKEKGRKENGEYKK